jgi:hypothetical protein
MGRRVIAAGLVDILSEGETDTFWASTVPSVEQPGVRYVWMTYPQLPEGTPVRDCEAHLLAHLRRYMLVACSTFKARVVVGVGLPNRDANAQSYLICVLNGSNWTTESEEEAEFYRSQGIFSDLQEVPLRHTR